MKGWVHAQKEKWGMGKMCLDDDDDDDGGGDEEEEEEEEVHAGRLWDQVCLMGVSWM